MYWRVLLKRGSGPLAANRTEYIRILQRIMALLWVNLARTRSTRHWAKMHAAWSSWPASFYPDVDNAWNSDSVLYLFTSVFCTAAYGGESCDPMRRAEEYVSRIAQGHQCRTPQPFFQLFWSNGASHRQILWRLSHWTVVPLAYGGPDRTDRLIRERHMIRTLQLRFNPPLVSSLLQRCESLGSLHTSKSSMFLTFRVRVNKRRPFKHKTGRARAS